MEMLQRAWLECGHILVVDVPVEVIYTARKCVRDWERCTICATHPHRIVVKVEMVDQLEMREFWEQERQRFQAMSEARKERKNE